MTIPTAEEKTQVGAPAKVLDAGRANIDAINKCAREWDLSSAHVTSP